MGSLPKLTFVKSNPIQIDDEDELAVADTIPCSPGAVLRCDDHTTQPTQVLQRPTLEPSSPSSIVEVPASSPFQQPPKRPSSFFSRMAPAGTRFQAPTQNTNTTNKRPADPIDLISEDEYEDDDLPPLSDIQPTNFKAHISSFAYDSGDDRRPATGKALAMKNKLRKIFDVYGDRYAVGTVKESLTACDGDVEGAIEWLAKYGRNHSTNAQASKPGRRLVNKAALNAGRPTPSSSRGTTPQQQQQPPPKKRRLMQGRRNPTPSPRKPSPQRLTPGEHPSSDDPLVVDLVDNDEGDAFQGERSPTPDESITTRILNYINTSAQNEIAAITGIKEVDLAPVIEKRPFDNVRQAKKVQAPQKPNARKKSRIPIGETIVEKIEAFLQAAEAIDKVVAACEVKAATVKEAVDAWDINSFGYDKRSTRSTPELPPTPSSLSSLVRPPIPKQPEYMDGHCSMKPFQLFGLNWMALLHKLNTGCILADEMGLGKTCQVISFISHLVEDWEDKPQGAASVCPWPNLVVVPPSTYNNWLAEFEKFAPDLSVIGYRGSQAERAEIAEDVRDSPEDYHVVLATYSQINNEMDIESLNRIGMHAAIYDEGHKMKNPETKIYKDLLRVQADWKMLLTGTPVQNNLLEMTSLLNFINPQIFKGCMEHIKYIFSQKVTIRDITNGAFLYSERVKRARTILEPFILQRRKDQVLSDMPAKVNTVTLCDMTESQKSVYDGYEAIFRQEPSQRKIKGGRGNDMNNCWMQLRKAAIHPLLFRKHFTDAKVEKMGRVLFDTVDQSELRQPNLGHLIQELKNQSDFELHLWCRDYPRLIKKYDYPPEVELDSGKTRKLLELIDQYQQNGDRVLVFSKFSRVIQMLCETLAMKGIDHRVLDGSTNVGERQAMIDEYNSNPEIPVFLLTTGAGGTGINLTSANKVVIFDQSDNPQDDIQAENRAHRLGQKRDVEIIRLIARGTIEELIHKACQKKIELANKVTGAVEDQTDAEAAKNMEQEVRRMMELTPP
ncbi:ATP-dependent helicase-like protein [Emericellopsis cladophorae]|uniref:ATP-dependent helicase-like protein n=1 Tax=Emericellopsis cladophorae TaxID=2686198 RepID=A0A9P9XWD2_9HYPO|nr:ATP-dependent helicase-like protein [Emericellopsis cladophorae]KAI6779066.1 ATP-dependent helicase-like protein [Emericellopsis cladophorae]